MSFLKAVGIVSGMALALSHATQASADQLIIDVVGIKRPGGTMMVAVFDSAESWDDGKEPTSTAKDSVLGAKVRLIFPDLASGTYAVKLYHDENNNGKLDTNMLGIPSEGYGFSNDKKILGAPGFAESMFVLEGDTTLQIKLN
ncbi:MAG: DUF2141 domain-containing protein [Congregibacter sp.]|nr:DUF2141 domain-containing protein [Congregibacter sp.]